ncbi:uncharacterized protein LOC131989498 [Centropristis striata]|uniref:uncharacterized protein LOC131989498 n=1 Tax=Centropristis striata TaxID=184440 RepID=UPI0027DF7904|nr:uncharacterized protein LOC131989498 [Centropristis striata]
MDVTVFIKHSCWWITTIEQVRMSTNEFESITVLQLKEKLEPLTGEPVGEQRLVFAGKQLEDDARLVSCGIQHKTTIELILNVRVIVKGLTGKTIKIDLPDNEFKSITVLQLKAKLEPLTGEPVGEQRLVFSGTQLKDDRLLVSYRIHRGAPVHLILKNDVTVFVKCSGLETIAIHLCDNKFQSVTVLQLKEKLEPLFGVPVEEQRLIFSGKQLEDDALLVSCGIQHKTTIELILNVTVIVKDLTGETIKIDLHEFQSITVLQLKEKLEPLTGEPVGEQRLVFAGKQLEDDALLVSCGIQHKTTIELILKNDVTVFVKWHNGETILIYLSNNEFESVTVLQLKEKIQKLKGFPGNIMFMIKMTSRSVQSLV